MKFFLRVALKALTARLPEFLLTLIGFFLVLNGVERILGLMISVDIETTNLAGAIIGALTTDLLPGWSIFVINEILWERKSLKRSDDLVVLSNLLEEIDSD